MPNMLSDMPILDEYDLHCIESWIKHRWADGRTGYKSKPPADAATIALTDKDKIKKAAHRYFRDTPRADSVTRKTYEKLFGKS